MEIEDNKTGNEVVIYQPDEITELEIRVQDETVWLTQAQISELFQRDQSVIARHIRNVFEEHELEKDSNMQILHNTLSRYKPATIRIYNTDASVLVMNSLMVVPSADAAIATLP